MSHCRFLKVLLQTTVPCKLAPVDRGTHWTARRQVIHRDQSTGWPKKLVHFCKP